MKLLKILLILQFIMLASCGYKAINNKYNYTFKIIDYKLVGNSTINEKIITALFIKEDKNKFQNNKIFSNEI